MYSVIVLNCPFIISVVSFNLSIVRQYHNSPIYNAQLLSPTIVLVFKMFSFLCTMRMFQSSWLRFFPHFRILSLLQIFVCHYNPLIWIHSEFSFIVMIDVSTIFLNISTHFFEFTINPTNFA